MGDQPGLSLPDYPGDDERTLRSHLRLLHGLYTNDEKTIDGLVECHRADHAEGFGRLIRHTHTEPTTTTDELEEWSWE